MHHAKRRHLRARNEMPGAQRGPGGGSFQLGRKRFEKLLRNRIGCELRQKQCQFLCAASSSFSNEIENASVMPWTASFGTWPSRLLRKRSNSAVSFGA